MQNEGWLISAILVEFNHLHGSSNVIPHRPLGNSVVTNMPERDLVGRQKVQELINGLEGRFSISSARNTGWQRSGANEFSRGLIFHDVACQSARRHRKR